MPNLLDSLLTRLVVRVIPHIGDQLSPKLVSLLEWHVISLLERHVNATLLAEVHNRPEAGSAHHCGLDAGGPLGPVPRSFRIVPAALRCCEALPTQEEVAGVRAVRDIFRVGNGPDPWMNDVIRAFRLIRGARTYMEIGTEDRGNLAFASKLLSEDAVIIGLDIQDNPAQDEKLRRFLKPTQTYLPIVGDSRLPSTFVSVKDALEGRRLDAVFIDGNHIAHAVLCDYTNYEELVKDDGVILFHDSLWEGGGLYKGVADMLAEINTVDPVYLIDGDNLPRRFMRQLWKGSIWGVVGVVFASEQRWRDCRKP